MEPRHGRPFPSTWRIATTTICPTCSRRIWPTRSVPHQSQVTEKSRNSVSELPSVIRRKGYHPSLPGQKPRGDASLLVSGVCHRAAVSPNPRRERGGCSLLDGGEARRGPRCSSAKSLAFTPGGLGFADLGFLRSAWKLGSILSQPLQRLAAISTSLADRYLNRR
jgi:hypothetical protein